MDEIETFFIIAEPVHSQCTLLYPYGFLMFSEDRERVHWERKC